MSFPTPRLDRLEINALINGGMDLSQRAVNNNVTLTTTPSYLTVDRWRTSYSGTVTGTPNSSRTQSGLPTNNLSRYASQLDVRRNGGTATVTWEQRIEGQNARFIFGSSLKACVGAMVKAPVTGTQARITLNVPTSEDNYASVTQVYQAVVNANLTAGTWTQISAENIALPANIANGLSVVIDLILPSGTDGANVNSFMTQAICNPGSQLAGFKRHGVTAAEEEDACLRYYEKSYAIDTVPGTATYTNPVTGLSSGSDGVSGGRNTPHHSFKVTKRVAPACQVYDPGAGTAGQARAMTSNTAFATSVKYTGTKAISIDCTAFPATDLIGYHFTADSEL